MSIRVAGAFLVGLAVGGGLGIALATPAPAEESSVTPFVVTQQKSLPPRIDADSDVGDRDGSGLAAKPAPERRRLVDGWMPTAPLDATCTLRARVVGPDGVPIADRSLSARARFGSHEVTGFVRTGRDGTMAFVVRGVLPPNVPGVLELEPGAPSFGIQIYVPPAEGASAALPHPLPTGVVELGDVALRERALVGGGTVAAPGGRATVTFHVTFVGGRSLQFPVRVGADGRFELRHPNAVQQASLSVECDGYLPVSEQPVALGDAHIRIAMVRAGTVSGRVHSPAGGRPYLELLASDGQVHRSPTRWWNSKSGILRFTFRALPAGPAIVRYGRSATDLAEIRVLVEPGGVGLHEALQNLRVQ